MVKQAWRVVIDESTHEVEYRFSKLSGKTVLVVDGDAFTVKGKPLCIGVQRREPVIVGMCQGILSISKGGRAELVVNDATEIIKII